MPRRLAGRRKQVVDDLRRMQLHRVRSERKVLPLCDRQVELEGGLRIFDDDRRDNESERGGVGGDRRGERGSPPRPPPPRGVDRGAAPCLRPVPPPLLPPDAAGLALAPP